MSTLGTPPCIEIGRARTQTRIASVAVGLAAVVSLATTATSPAIAVSSAKRATASAAYGPEEKPLGRTYAN